VTGAAYENEGLANSVFVLGTVSSGRAAERVSGGWQRVGQDVLSGRLEHRSPQRCYIQYTVSVPFINRY